MIYVAEVEPHTHPVSWHQLAMVGVQILIAVVTVIMNRRYYQGVSQRGELSLKTQKADALLRHQQDNERIGTRIRQVRESIVVASLYGTRFEPKLSSEAQIEEAHTRLSSDAQELNNLTESFRGIINEAELLDNVRKILSNIDAYKNAVNSPDPHAERVKICAAIDINLSEFQRTWDEVASARVADLKPQSENQGKVNV